jgi:uncharacterized protein (DUF362 family)
MVESKNVTVYKQAAARYSNNPPYDPPEGYPEYQLEAGPDSTNETYRSIRESFALLGMDTEHYGNANWNPLGRLINPGETVLLKPNLIAHSQMYNDEWEHVITHGSVIRAMIDYVYIALGGRGRIIIADAPQTDSQMDLIKQRIGIEAIQDLYWRQKKFEIIFLDLRDEHWIVKDGVYVEKVKLPGDPVGNARVNLAHDSFFSENDGLNKRYYGAFYDVAETNEHHRDGVHEYMISRTALEADVFINLPKLKTHKKVGVTLNLKNLVGINGNKNWLPHYAIGSPDENGDQFPCSNARGRLENRIVLAAKRLLLGNNPVVRLAARKFKGLGYRIFGGTEEIVRSGNWYGNDTCWRMTLDLNRILLYANPDGTFRTNPKRYFSMIDGIRAMEGNGPVAGKPKNTGFIIAGYNPPAVDVVCAQVMGLDYRKIPMLYRSFDRSKYPLAPFMPRDICVVSNQKALRGTLASLLPEPTMRFESHFGWKGHVEL